ncbi:hypothetical protein ABTH43_19530, partial [Acinetobacter baumannii]
FMNMLSETDRLPNHARHFSRLRFVVVYLITSRAFVMQILQESSAPVRKSVSFAARSFANFEPKSRWSDDLQCPFESEIRNGSAAK